MFTILIGNKQHPCYLIVRLAFQFEVGLIFQRLFNQSFILVLNISKAKGYNHQHHFPFRIV